MFSEKYKDLYLSTTQEQLKSIADVLLLLERNPKNPEYLQTLFISLHSMKGSAATMGYKDTIVYLHQIESLVQAMINGTLLIDKNTLDLIFRSLDTLHANLQYISQHSQELDFKQAIADLEKILKSPVKIKKSDKLSAQHDQTALVAPYESTEMIVPAKDLDKIQNLLDDLLVNIMSIKGVAIKSAQSQILSKVVTADTLANNLRRELERMRILPLEQVFSNLPYLVRSIARDEHKNVELLIEHNDISLDKSILDELLEIIVQLIKNSVVHGIKSSQKNGQINLHASLESDELVVTVSDNGRGIDWSKVLALAVNKKVISVEASRKLKLVDIPSLLFHPGMSSKKNMDIHGGRGVGLSVVKDRIKKLNGQVEIASTLNKGTKFTLHLPLPLSIFRSIAWQVGDWSLAVPMAYVDRVVKLPEIKDFSNDKYFVYNKKRIKLLNLHTILPLEIKAPAKYILFLNIQKNIFALPIASSIKESELVMKKNPSVMRLLPKFKGLAISSSGRVNLILDINNLL
ncbi:MAG: Histidine kinase [Patescibacteria group bacterium]|nr:Histidine kinase [Patescibacteria group bacterium]